MSRDTKFGYGFLLAGAGLPYLIDKLLGPIPAVIAAAVCLLAGLGLLIAGHFHSEKLGKPHGGIMATIGLFTVIGAASGALIGGLSGAIWSIAHPRPAKETFEKKEPEPAAPRPTVQEIPAAKPSDHSTRAEAKPTEGTRRRNHPKVHEGSDPFSEFDDAELLEWGKPLVSQIDGLLNRLQESDLKYAETAREHPENGMAPTMATVNRRKTFIEFMNCCFQDASKYTKEIISRLPGGNDDQSALRDLDRMARYQAENSEHGQMAGSTQIQIILENIKTLNAKLGTKVAGQNPAR